MGLWSAARTRTSRNHIGACTADPASRADSAFRDVRERDLFIALLVDTASRFA